MLSVYFSFAILPTLHSQQLESWWHHRRPRRQIKALYLNVALRQFALSFLGIFLPIFVLRLFTGAPHYLPSERAILWVFTFIIIERLAVVLGAIGLGALIFRVGFRRSIFVSNLLLVLTICLWYLAERQSYLILASAVTVGLAGVFYWIPFHIFFTRKGDDDHHFGREAGQRDLVLQVAAVAGPLVGGWVIARGGFNPLFLLTLILVLVSGLPVTRVVHDHHHQEHPFGEVWRRFRQPPFRRLNRALWGAGLEDVIQSWLWPVAVYIILGSTLKLGALITVTLGVSLISVAFVGGYIDRRGPGPIHRVSTLVNAAIWLGKIGVQSFWVAAGLDLFDRLDGPFYSVPYMAQIYEKASRVGESDFFLYREVVINLARIIPGLVGVGLVWLGLPWRLVFLLAVVGSVLTYQISVDDN